MKYPVSSLYTNLPENHYSSLLETIEKGLDVCQDTCHIFFRADDIGVPSTSYFAMIDMFKRCDIPLCLAVVPTWLTSQRAEVLLNHSGENSLFCFHQHGWRHINHEDYGKKQEFGDSREYHTIYSDIARGKKRLQRVLGSVFYPFFTPPWNRCGEKSLKALSKLEFHGISRSKGASLDSIPLLPDYQVNIDLHTRKELSPTHSFEKMLLEISHALASGTAGFMIHHQRMNDSAQLVLSTILSILAKRNDVTFFHFAHNDR